MRHIDVMYSISCLKSTSHILTTPIIFINVILLSTKYDEESNFDKFIIMLTLLQVEYAMRQLYVLVNLCELQSMDLSM